MHQLSRSVSMALVLTACLGAGAASAQPTTPSGDAGRGSHRLMLIDGLVDYNQVNYPALKGRARGEVKAFLPLG